MASLPGRARAVLAAAAGGARAAAGTRWSRHGGSGGRVAAPGGDRGRGRCGRAGRAGAAAAGARRWPPIPVRCPAGAPPVAGRLAAELIARGSAALAVPACAVCGRTGKPLFRGDGGGVCQRCRAWQLARPCATCGKVKPAAGIRRARQGRLRGLPPPGRPAPPPRVRHVREDRAGRGARPGRAAGHLRELLPDARGHLQQMPAAAPVQLRGHQPAGLPVVLAAGHRRLRALRAGPAAAGPLAGGAGLRPVLHRRAAPPGAVRALRAAAAAGRPARPGR